MNFGINVIQIFDQIWTFYFFLERTSMSLTFKRYKFKLNFYKQKSNKTIKKKDREDNIFVILINHNK